MSCRVLTNVSAGNVLFSDVIDASRCRVVIQYGCLSKWPAGKIIGLRVIQVIHSNPHRDNAVVVLLFEKPRFAGDSDRIQLNGTSQESKYWEQASPHDNPPMTTLKTADIGEMKTHGATLARIAVHVPKDGRSFVTHLWK